MSSAHCVFLPGLDGSADLMIVEFSSLSPAHYSLTTVALPDDPTLDYQGLADHVSHFLLNEVGVESVHVIAESFSGPMAILLAHQHPGLISKLTLVATFAKSPAPFIARYLPWRWIFKCKMPNFVARYFFGAENELAIRLRSSIKLSSPETLMTRINCLLNVDVTRELSELQCPIEYIRATDDRLVSRTALSTIVAANPNVIVHEVEGPHLIVQTQPQKVWDCIRNAEDIH